MANPYGEYETVIGLEVHAQLLTRTKAFCSCATSFGDPPNTHTCPVCLGLPGALPVLSEEAVRMAASAALALGCQLRPKSVFSRKNYFYPDLPKGYQISQYDEPLAMHGVLDIETEQGKRRARILRVHMEEDAGKNVHGMGDESVVDLNRAGTPLIEIVGEPDLRSGAEAAEYLKRLREILMFIGVNDGNLEQGSFRCDANVSVRKAGEEKLGTRTELKNINSFKFVADAIDVEAKRQIALLERGERVRQQTRGYNADKRETYLLRDKENEAGYRYFPEPDLPPLVLSEEFVDDVREALPASAADRRRHYVDDLGLSPQAAIVLTGHPEIASFFDTTVFLYTGSTPAKAGAVKVANFVQSEVLRDVHPTGLAAEMPVSPAQVAELLRLVDRGTISGKQAKEVYALMRGTAALPESIVEERHMAVLSDEGTLEALANELVAQNPKQAASFRAGKANLLGFFVGQMMKQTGGSADPAAVNRILKRVLTGEVDREAATPLVAPAPKGAPGSAEPVTRDAPVHESPRSGTRETGKQSPLAQSVAPPPPPHVMNERTLTSADAGAVVLPSPVAPPPEVVSPEAFAKIDLRVGRVARALRVADSEELLDLAVDVGDEGGPRRVVQRLGLSFVPEELVGKRVLVVCNLPPSIVAEGQVSEGLVLAAGPPEGLALALVAEEVRPGTRVRP
jgi:aspartyl-tRNA(Asn)/glutamyl-tRNA(Gln) amidotransferase subunit B